MTLILIVVGLVNVLLPKIISQLGSVIYSKQRPKSVVKQTHTYFYLKIMFGMCKCESIYVLFFE